MKYSILFFCWDPEQKLINMTKDSLMSIVTNSRGMEYELFIMDRPGLYAEMNRGARISNGEYIIHFFNDILLEDPEWLSKMAIPDTVTGAHDTIGPSGEPEVDGSPLCIPRNVWDTVGDWDESFKGYGWSDQDYLYRVRKEGFALKGAGLKRTHLENQTNLAYNLRHDEDMERNKKYFLAKHGL